MNLYRTPPDSPGRVIYVVNNPVLMRRLLQEAKKYHDPKIRLKIYQTIKEKKKSE